MYRANRDWIKSIICNLALQRIVIAIIKIEVGMHHTFYGLARYTAQTSGRLQQATTTSRHVVVWACNLMTDQTFGREQPPITN